MTLQQRSKRVAPESRKTRKTREKLIRHWDSVERQVTPEALKESTDEIHRWIARHAHQRVPLKAKIALFDENQNAAGVSQRIATIAKKLSNDMQLFLQQQDVAQ